METRKLITESLSLNGFEHIDLLIWLAYVILVVSVSIYMCMSKESKHRTAQEYFLANHTMPWWAMGATIIAVNVSAEQLIGMTGTTYKYGIAVAAYEVMSTLVIVLVAKNYIPIFFSKKCMTVPQLMRIRYNNAVGTAFSVMWILTYIFLTLTSIAWLGSIAMEHMLGLQGCAVHLLGTEISIRTVIVVILLIVSGFCSIWGGQNAIAWTDVLHFIFIIIGGLITAYFTLCAVGGEEGTFIDGIDKLYTFFHTSGHTHDMHLHLIMRKSCDTDGFSQMPGIGMILGGLLIMNMCYWGFNQTIIQKGLAAENVTEARKGFIFAAFLKFLVPIIILIPGLSAYYFMQTGNGMMTYGSTIHQSNDTMAWIIANTVPTGIKGLFFATLTAAVISSLASVSNSTSALFTLDIYKKFINKKATDRQIVTTARWATAASLLISAIAMHPIIDKMEDGYAFIQEMSSYLYPAIMTLMTLGLFWKKATTRAAVTVVIATFPLGLLLSKLSPDLPFLTRIGYIYIFDVILMTIVSLTSKTSRQDNHLGATQRRKLTQHGFTMAGIAAVCYAVAIAAMLVSSTMPADTTPDINMFAYMMDISTNSLFIGGTMFLSSAISNISNGYCHTESHNALEFDMEEFKTSRNFTTLSIILILMVTLIYVIYW